MSWHDLPSELGEIILGQVPLLRLAQLAPLGKDFQSAYADRVADRVATAAWLRDASLGPLPADSRDVLSAESYIRTHPTWGCEARVATPIPEPPTGSLLALHWSFFEHWPMRTLVLPPPWRGSAGRVTRVGRLFIPRDPPVIPHVPRPAALRSVCDVSFRMSGWFSAYLHSGHGPSVEWCNVSCEVRSEVVIGRGGHRTMCCNDLVFRCFHERPEVKFDPLAFRLMLWIALAGPVRRFLCDVARGAPCDQGGGFQILPVQRVTLVLPRERPWPSGAGEVAMIDALTTILALVGGRGSGARIAISASGGCDDDVAYVVTRWRLPGALGRT
jgi:hypothetical protein